MTPVELNYQLLTRLARLTFSAEDVEAAKVLMRSPDFDKSLFLGTCFKQKVAGLAYFNITRWGIWRLLPWVGFPLKFFYLANRERNVRIQKELRRIMRAAVHHKLDIRPLKGSVLVPLLYDDGGSRLLIDIDFFVGRADITKAAAVFGTLGYVQGIFEKEKNCITPLTRKQKLLWQLKMFETPPFCKVTNDEYLDYGSHMTLDVSFGISFAEKGDVSGLILAKSATLAGLRTLSVVDFFIQLCGHLYKEASNEAWVEIDLDINLIKFCDVREFALMKLHRANFRQIRDRVQQLCAEKAVYFSLMYVYEIYKDGFVSDMIGAMAFTFEDEAFMTAIYRQGEKATGSRKSSLSESIGTL